MDAALVPRMIDAHNAGDDQALLASYASGATVHFAGWAEPLDAASWVAAQAQIRESFPDLRLAVGTVATAAGLVVAELAMTGTNSGVLHLSDDDRLVLRTDAPSLPATGGRMSTRGVVVLEVARGLVTAERHYWPTVQSLVQLGLVQPRSSVPASAATR